MVEATSLFTPLEEELPAVYRRDPESWEQIRTYFRPFNVLCREFVLSLQELPAWMSPAAIDVTPPGSWDADATERVARQSAVLDEVASWFDFAFEPTSVWRLPDDPVAARRLLEDKAATLRALPRLMRTRSTAPGFLELFCATFRLDPASKEECPVLIEYCAHRAPGGPEIPVAGEPDCPSEDTGDDSDAEDRIVCDDPEGFLRDDGIAWRVSMLLPPVEAFTHWDGLREVQEWIERNAPAHLWIDIHRVTASFWPELVDDVLPGGASREQVLAMVRANVTEAESLHADGNDELNVGRLRGRDEGDQA